MKLVKGTLCAVALSVLAACGGGGGGTAAITSTPTTIAGAVIDGYVQGATVCLDVNGNGTCDASEPTATTAADGSYSLSYTGSTAGMHVISVIPSTAKDSDDGGLTLAQAGKAAYTLMAPAPASTSTNTTVTPLTTLVSNQMKQSGNTDAATVESQLKQQLGISSNLLNNDYKASNSAANVTTAQLASTIASAIAAAQQVLQASTTFQSALNTTDAGTIQAAAQQAAINLITKTVVPSIVDKTTGALNGSVNSSTIISSVQDVAGNSAESAAIKATAPPAQSATLQAFLDGLAIGQNSPSGDYIDASGNRVNGKWNGYTNSLTVNYIKGNASTQTGSEVNKVLVNGTWFTKYDDGSDYFMTASGWTLGNNNLSAKLSKDITKPDSTDTPCLALPQTSTGPNQIVCLTKYDYSGKKVSSYILNSCTDSNGKTYPNCDINTVFPVNSFVYSVSQTYDSDTYRINYSTTWNGYGDGLNPKQTTLVGFVSFMNSHQDVGQTFGNSCNTAFKIKDYNASLKTGTIIFADMSSYKTCDAVFSNNNIQNANFKESLSFKITTVNGEDILIVNGVSLIGVKNNPQNTDQNAADNMIFAAVNGKIFNGAFWKKGHSYTIGLDGYSKIGNSNVLDTYLKMIGTPAFPYPN